MNQRTSPTVSLAGHPFAPIGMGEHLRCSFRCFRAVGARPEVFDIYRAIDPDASEKKEFRDYLSDDLGDINIFHINGNEVAQAFDKLGADRLANKFNIIYPAWELARYPREWAEQLDRFDEIWAPSTFIADSIKTSASKPVKVMPLACQPVFDSFLSRRYFQIPEDRYAFLFFFDFRSFSSRKNPEAVIRAFEKVLEQRPYARVSLVVKFNGSEHEPEQSRALKEKLATFTNKVVVIDRIMSDNEVKNLVRVCDSFISLHRSEGFGRGMSEAMSMGLPTIATAYSGNMEFMTPANSLCVDHKMIPVGPGEYPHGDGQQWADPDVDQASTMMVKLIDDPREGRRLGQQASRDIRRKFSYRHIGLNYLARIKQLR